MYEKITLPNGVRILSERMEGIRSAAMGIWVASGSRDESAAENGAAHFIEHMVFKGSETRSATELAQQMDIIGGQINAFTTKECTCFYGRALDSHLTQVLDILCTLVFDARFDQADVELERGVVLEEIGMYRDEPDDLVSERLMAGCYSGSPLGRPILGTPATLKKMTGDSLRSWHHAHYGPDKLIVSLAGSIPQGFLEEIQERFSALTPVPSKPRKPAIYQPTLTLKKKATEQNHVQLAFPSLKNNDPKRYAMQLLSSVLGGGMSSRLFQEVREKRGLCYTVSSFGSTYQDTGIFSIYTATGAATEGEAITTIRGILDDFADHGVTQRELDRAREQTKANVLMGLESTYSRMSYLARCELDDGGVVLAPDQIIEAYDQVTGEDIRALAQETFRYEVASLSAVGRVQDEDTYRKLLGL
jgi:predicted Zn-dependent peptidase